ncbi:MAG TPA: hypothetical protein ENJ41_05940 [Oceanospirillales bacterium]|nr:hypothetical protein [Oceanospirillales bacterium]
MKKTIQILILTLIMVSCANHTTGNKPTFEQAIQKHLDSITSKNIKQMKQTVAESGEFYLTLPNGQITTTIKEFIDGQTAWFNSQGWRFSTEIIKQEHGPQYGYALVIANYHEADRGGKPYHHKMFISYDLKNTNGLWLIVKDHASTIEKSQ